MVLATVSASQFRVCSTDDYFYRTTRRHTTCSSTRPGESVVNRLGDYAHAFWMKNFFDGTLDMTLQMHTDGCVVLSIDDAQKAMKYENPLRDPVVVVRRDGLYSLKDGFHRVHEARARGYTKQVWTVVLDMDIDDDDDDDD